MAASSFTAKMQGYCVTDIDVEDKLYSNVKLYTLPDLCAHVILGQDWQAQHESVTIQYGG